jgi:hypothetical protein
VCLLQYAQRLFFSIWFTLTKKDLATTQAEIAEKIKTQLDEQKVFDRLIYEKQQAITINKIIEDAIKERECKKF